MYVLAVYRKFEKCRELDLENTRNLYKKMPLRFFHSLRRLNLKGATISTGDFGRVTSVAKRLRSLNIENCINVDESSIFKAKDCLSRLERINITTNMHFSVRAIACLCSYLSLTEVCANGILLDHTDMLFEDFSPFKEWRYSAGNWQNYFDIVDIAAEDDILKSYFKFILAFLLLLLRNCYVLGAAGTKHARAHIHYSFPPSIGPIILGGWK